MGGGRHSYDPQQLYGFLKLLCVTYIEMFPADFYYSSILSPKIQDICSAWLRPKLNTKITLNHPPP